MSITLDPLQQLWMTDARTREVLRALTDDGGAARFVGGAVRNALLGVAVTDVDIATPLVPDEVMRRLKAAGLGAVPTGIEHGTVTAIVESTPYEVTTLRRDVATDGRRAVVAFTTDWKEDAARRDFTMNALYADETGRVFDYFGGIADLQERQVRFVGDPTMRIREDFLRILRLFRFHAWYGKGEIDPPALAAAASEKAGLKTLSGERVQKEMLRLLEAPDPMLALDAMARTGILAEIIPGASLGILASLLDIAHAHALKVEPIPRLAALLPDADAAAVAARRFRLSNADRDRLIALFQGKPELEPAQQSLYAMEQGAYRDALVLRWAKEPDRADTWRKLEALSRDWVRPQFPLNGADIMAQGIAEGPRVGALLLQLEQEWLKQEFKPNRDALLARLRTLAKNP